MTVIDDAKQKLQDIEKGVANVGFNLLGIAALLLSTRWTATQDGNAPSEQAATLSLASQDEWVAPAPGVLSLGSGAERIVFADGAYALPPADFSVFRLHPQVQLRLARLYASFIESRTDDQLARQVPLYFVYRGATRAQSAQAGAHAVGDPLGLAGGSLSIHDERGLPIDPVAVAGVFDALLTQFPTLEPRDKLSAPPLPVAQRQLNLIAKLNAGAAPLQRLRLIDPHGQPLKDATALQNLTTVSAAAGLYAPAAAGSTIAKATGAPADLRLGLATHGSLAASLALPANTRQLARDFLSAIVVDLKPYLIGERPGDDPAAPFEALPDVRHQESMHLSLDGATALGAANALLANTPADAFVVAPVLRGDFALPDDATPAKAQWPAFPAPGSTNTAAIPGTLASSFAPEAHFITSGGSGADVLLSLHGLQAGQAVRVYPRVFLPDAREGRGDGAGGVVTDPAGSLSLRLTDPLGLVPRGASAPSPLPSDTVLHVDVVVANAAGKARVFGNVVAQVSSTPPPPAPTPPPVSNRFEMVGVERGIAPAGVLGLPGPALPPLTSPVALALALSGEGNPRQAPRLPTMARRDTIVASATLAGTARNWQAQLSGAHLVPGTLNAQQRLGSPGSPGGPEFQSIAADTAGGLLAYDLARAALRRTRHVLPRLVAIDDARWTPPAAATGGTLSAALLQTVAPVAETPELAELEDQKKWLGRLPATWADVVAKLLPDLPDKLPDFLKNAIKQLTDDVKNSANHQRLYEEFKRDFCTSVHGRRDAQWALQRALGSARELVYLEGPAFSATGYGSAAATTDLVTLLAQRMAAAPGLRVVLALSKELDYGPGYEPFAAREYAQRIEAVNRLRAVDPARVVVFHPIGFPGRPLRLTGNLVIVDDFWAMLGSSTWRRRGLTFDGGLDLALVDSRIQHGRGSALADLRRQRIGGHLGVAAPAAGALPHPTWVRLADAHGAFAACQELLAHGGAGLIEPLWDGAVPGRPRIPASDFPKDDVADPDGRDINSFVLLMIAALQPAGFPPVQP